MSIPHATAPDSSYLSPVPRLQVDVADLRIGPETFTLIAGACSVVDRDATLRDAVALAEAGAATLRGGWKKPRTSPHSFQGGGLPSLEILAEVKAVTGLPIVSEITDVRDLESMLGIVDLFQLGARNMQHQPLLTELGRARVPVLLKRGFGSTIEETLAALEYILIEGNTQVILYERGIRTFETAYRFTLDIAAIQPARPQRRARDRRSQPPGRAQGARPRPVQGRRGGRRRWPDRRGRRVPRGGAQRRSPAATHRGVRGVRARDAPPRARGRAPRGRRSALM